ATSLETGDPPPSVEDLLERIDALRASGGDVLLLRERELYTMTDYLNRYTKEHVRFVVGLSLLIRVFEDRYSKLPGSFLEALSRLFAQRSEEHTSELQSHVNLVCRLLLEKKKR